METKRPLSAIFLGSSASSGAPGSLPPLQTQSSPQRSTPNGGGGLPSPPATNSTASTGKESLPKRVRKTSIAFATVKSMLTGERREHDRERERQRRQAEAEAESLMEDEDHTARLSGPAPSTSSDGSMILGRSTSFGARSTTSSGGFDRVKSLADRNRMVLDKLSSISSAASSRLQSPAPTDRVPLTASTLKSRGASPMPPSNNTLFPPKSNTSATGSSPRGSYASLSSPNVRQLRDIDQEVSPMASRIADSAREGSARREPEESTTPKERERLYSSQRTHPAFTVSGDGNPNGARREGSVRVSFSRTRPELDVDEFGMNKPQTRQRAYSSESDDRSTTPPADASRRYAMDSVQTSGGRGRRVSINEPDASPTKGREPLRTRAAAGTLGRQRNSSEIIERTVAAARKSPVRTRGALPSEFRSGTEGKRSSLDYKRFSLDGRRTYSRSSNSPDLSRRETGVLTRDSPTTGGSRAATVRESSRRTHSRWMSEDTSADGNELSGAGSRPRYERRGGSIESPIIPGGRSVVGESLKAAGISKRRDVPEPGSAPISRPVDSRDSVDWEVEQLRNGIARVGVGDDQAHEDHDSDEEGPNTTPGNKRVTSRTVQNIITSRPGTSSGNYVDDGPRTAPPALRPYRSVATGLMTPSGSGTVRDRGPTPVTPAGLISAASTEHIRLMLESFAMFESSLARIEGSSTGGGTGAVSELLQNTDVVVQASQSLNNLLRESAAKTLSEQIEAEVEDRDSREVEIWRAVGGDFRDAVKICDELVRSMTNLLLGVGRVLKERGPGEDDNTRSSGRVSSSELRNGRMSAEGIRSGRMSAEGLRSGRMSAEGIRSGRMSAEGLRGARLPESNRLVEEDRRVLEMRRSLDNEALWKVTSREPTRLHDPLRPQTSMSLIREKGRISPIDGGGARQPASSRRYFPSRQSPLPQSSSDADTSFGTDTYESPSPATRHLTSNGEHHRERILSIPPSLESVPSESIIRQSTKTPTITRRPRISVGTIRGAAPFSTPAPGPASTHLSTAIAVGNGSPEKAQRSISYTVSRSGGAATVSTMTGLQAQARKRTISTADPLEPEVSSPTELSDASPTQKVHSTMTRTRASVDFSMDEGSVSGTERRARRRTATELFTS